MNKKRTTFFFPTLLRDNLKKSFLNLNIKFKKTN